MESTPTRFGAVDLRLEVADGDYCLSVARAVGNQEPTSVTLRWPGQVVDATADLDPIDDHRWTVPVGTDAFEAKLRR